MQKEVTFYYFGTKFIKWKAKLPVYLLKPKLCFGTHQEKFSQEVATFVENDVLEFSSEISILSNLAIHMTKFVELCFHDKS